ncbi:MAG: prepilin-type N-terminal cleavage/methylation domain-containing protein [Nitrospirae bacterium]|nr:prepilin-type N-terminal cleavage/methylation domain-containing protein [Nitrospirota bacterium]MBI3594534.1 prepilin-type N-terminal cleavage/methylation domain-containing protein [Nitrospirota bacterium]
MWKKNSGFTLLEVMIALTLVAIVFVPLLSLRNQNIQETYSARQLLRADFLSHEKLTGFQLTEKPEAGETKGTFDDPFSGFRWEQTVSETPLGGVREVRFKVIWKKGERDEEAEWVEYFRNSPG